MKFLFTHTAPLPGVPEDHVIEVNSLEDLIAIAAKAAEDGHDIVVRTTWHSEKQHDAFWAIEIYNGYRE